MQESAVVGNSRWTESERAAIANEMHCILTSPVFKSSKRCPALLRCIVEHALAGEATGMKERSLGIEVFERDPNYDTSVDPIVRMTANEIRKRLAQWYQEPNHHHQVKIHLVAGSYLPEFEFEPQENRADPAAKGPEEHAESAIVVDQNVARQSLWARSIIKWILSSAAILVLVSVAVFAVIRSNIFRPADYMFWKPILDANGELIICISDNDELVRPDMLPTPQSQGNAGAISTPEAPTPEGSPAHLRMSPWVDSSTAFYVNGWLNKNGKRASLRSSSALTLHDLRQGPAVLIGTFNNPWALILLSNLRYSVHADPATQEAWIQDAMNPSKRDWKITGSGPITVDYAIISRFFDTQTGQWIVAIGGLTAGGTDVSGTLLTSSGWVNLLPAVVRKQTNVQIVVRTDLINGNPGPPQIVAVHTW